MTSRVRRVKGAWVASNCQVCSRPRMGVATCIEIESDEDTFGRFVICMRCARRIAREVAK